MHELFNEVLVNLNVFCTLMLHCVAINVYVTLNVTQKSGGMILLNDKLCH
jgi:hypothetical protein